MSNKSDKFKKVEPNKAEKFLQEITDIADDVTEKIQHASNIVKGQKILVGEGKKFVKNLFNKKGK